MRILWASDAPHWPTGFGNITRTVCAGLAQQGHDVSVLGGDECRRVVRRRHFTVLPGNGRRLDPALLRRYVKTLHPDVLVTMVALGDVGPATRGVINRLRRSAGFVWVLYYPIHGERRDGPLPTTIVRLLGAADIPVVMS